MPRHDERPESDPPGVIAGRYAVERELGRGGTAIVYLAHDRRYARSVAVKVLKPEFADSVATRRFLNEIAITAALQHPHILPILDSGEVAGMPPLDGLPFHVTPYLDGDSLRSRLERERQLPVDDALRIACAVADALEHAHAHGIVHRDIKPENILFSGGHACVGDFGIAHALDRAAGDRLTSVGLAVGTLLYMSPEQAAGERELDARSDVYSLACVLYEMLAGVPPFLGATPESLIAQRLTHPPQPLRAHRPALAPWLEAAVAHALAVTPADRYRSAREFGAALAAPPASMPAVISAGDAAPPPAPAVRRMRRPGRRALAAIALGLSLSLLALGSGRVRAALGLADDASDADAGRWVVLPVAGAGGRRLTPDLVRDHLHAALRHWRDLDLVAAGAAGLPVGAAGSVVERVAAARGIGAGRVVDVQITPVGDSVQVRATLHDADAIVLREHSVRVPDTPEPHDRYRELATALLRVAPPPTDTDEGDRGTDRLAAWHAYARGHDARRRWALDAAEREFRAAIAADPGFAQAQLWAAQVAAWERPDRRDDWSDAAAQAAARADRLTERDALLARGVHALATERYPEACDAYRRLRELAPRSDLPWYGLSLCQAGDPVVVRDRRSPSGWSFRGSLHAAAIALDSAIARADGAPAFAFRQLQQLLFVEPARIRGGRAYGADTTTFAAYPSLDSDTLAFVPYLLAEFAGGAPHVGTPTHARTLRRNADELAAHFDAWARRAPGNVEPLAALALVQELRAEPDPRDASSLLALRTTREARRRASSPAQRLALAVAEARLLVKSGRFAEARRLADSLLTAARTPGASQAAGLAGLAALVGDVGRAAALLQLASDAAAGGALTEPRVPSPLAAVGATLTAHAALGACTDTLPALVRRFDELLVRHVDAEARDVVRRAALERPLSLAVPCLGRLAAARLPAAEARLVRMQRAWGVGDIAAVRAHFDTLQRTRTVSRPGDITLDHTYQEAWLLVAIGDSVAAARHLELPLTALSTLGTRWTNDVPQAAALVRALALRADLAAAAGDRATARAAAGAVVALWTSADPALQPVVQRMRALAK